MNKADMIELARRRSKSTKSSARVAAEAISLMRKGNYITTSEIARQTGLSVQKVANELRQCDITPVETSMVRNGGAKTGRIFVWDYEKAKLKYAGLKPSEISQCRAP